MKIQNISKLQQTAIKEAQKEVDRIYKKYSKLIQQEISEQLPKNHKLIIGNGMCFINDKDGNEINSGGRNFLDIHEMETNPNAIISAKNKTDHNPKMDYIASLQFKDIIQGNIKLPKEIKSTKK